MKEKEIDKTENNIINWAMSNHLECLKTELIFKNIIIPIEN